MDTTPAARALIDRALKVRGLAVHDTPGSESFVWTIRAAEVLEQRARELDMAADLVERAQGGDARERHEISDDERARRDAESDALAYAYGVHDLGMDEGHRPTAGGDAR